MKIGAALLYFVAGLQTLSSAALLLGNSESTFETDTGVAWADLADTFPTVAFQFSMSNMASQVANLALGVLFLLVIHFAFRKGQSWAWFALWIFPLQALPGVINLVRSDNPVWVAFFGGAVMLIAVFGLLISYPNFFSKKIS